VAEDHRSPGADVVDVTVPVGVEHTGAVAADKEGRLSADGSESADRRVDAAGDERFGSMLKFAGTVEFAGHILPRIRTF
jgi:hypothetical protein